MTTDPIVFYNRYTKKYETEKVMGERVLRWIYGTTSGKVALHVLLKRAFISRLMGRVKNAPRSAGNLAQFAKEYDIDMEEALRPIDAYASFNDFFTRKLKPGARPICEGSTVALPADGRHSGWQDASAVRGVFVKGQSFDIPALVGDSALASKYARGAIVISRLCPVDYHRFHFPLAGVPSPSMAIPGPLASVSPYCLRRRLAWLWTNKRERTILHTNDCGDVLILAVGAAGVGSIFQTYTPEKYVKKGAEQGYFAFGGSTVITLFEPGAVRLADDILENSEKCVETYAHQGDVLGYFDAVARGKS